MIAKRTSKNQVTLPKAIADEFPGVVYFDVTVKGSKILMVPLKISRVGEPLKEIRAKMKKLGVTGKDVGNAVTWARRRKR